MTVESELNRDLQVAAQASVERIAQLEQQLTQARSQIRTRTVYVRKPDGTVMRRKTSDSRSERSQESSRSTETTAQQAVAQVQVVERVMEKVKLVERALPNWRIGADVGQVLGATLKPSYGGELQRRLADSPISATLRFDSKRELRIGLNWEL